MFDSGDGRDSTPPGEQVSGKDHGSTRDGMEPSVDGDDVEISGGGDPGGGLGNVLSVLDRVIDTDPTGLSDEMLYSTALDLEAVRRRVDVASAALLTELGVRRSCDVDHGLSTEGWLAHNANLPLGATRSRVRVAKKLGKHFAPVLEAINDDRITWEHGRVIAKVANPRILDQLVEMTEELLVLADHMSFETWSREVHNIADVLDTEGGHKPGDDITDNHLDVSNFIDNTVVLSGQLCGEMGLTIRDSINDQANRIFHRMSSDAEVTNNEMTVPGRATLRALALYELIVRANGVTAGGSGPRVDLSLIVNASDPEMITSREGVRIGDTDKYTSLCDPVFHTIVMNAEGIVTDLGRTRRYASAAQRKAMAHRDGGCVFPGCDSPPDWTDAHHTHPWNKGGRTDLADLASLCRHHHGVTHRNDWTMTVTPDGWFTWTTPKGQILHSQRHGRQHPDPNRYDRPPDDKSAGGRSRSRAPSGRSSGSSGSGRSSSAAGGRGHPCDADGDPPEHPSDPGSD